MSQTKLNVNIVEHGFNNQADWVVTRNDTVEAIVRTGNDSGGEVVFTLPDKNGRYDLTIDKHSLVEVITKLGLLT